MAPLDRVEDERLVLALRDGDPDAFGRLFDRWYDRVHDLARRITRDDGLAADVAQDAFLAAWERLDRLEDPAAFGGWLLRIARNRALDVVRAPARARTQADDDVSLAVDEQAVAARLADLDDPASVVGDREVQELVWSAAATLGERDLTALDLSLRHGLEPAEIGEVLGINRNAANQLVHRMKGRLATAVRSRVLWSDGAPACAGLRSALEADGLDEFDARAVRVAERHAKACADCAGRQETRLDPTHLFAAVPIVAVPVLFKVEAAAALDAAGVPMSGSTAVGEGAVAADGVGPHGAGRPRHLTRRRLAAAAAVVAVVAFVVGVLAAERLDQDPPAGEEVASATAPEVTSPVEAAPVPTEGGITIEVLPGPDDGAPSAPAEDDAPLAPAPAPAPGGDPGGTPQPPPPPPPAAPTASISASPSSVPPTPGAPPVTVSWSSMGGTVTVSGPGLSSSSASGSQVVCPNGNWCFGPSGSYTYVITVTGPGGTTQDSVTVSVA